MSVTYPEPLWKTILDWPRYEISQEGQVRVKSGFTYAGRTLTRFWRDGKTTVGRNSDPHKDHVGSLCVELHQDGGHTTKRVWKLMERYWPGFHYPSTWKAPKVVAAPVRKDSQPDKRFKLSYEDTLTIKRSPLTPTELAKLYPVHKRYIRKLKQGYKC